MNAKKAKQARRLTASILKTSDPENLEPQLINVRQYEIPLPRTIHFFRYETATFINPRRRAYRKIKSVIREMPRLV